MEQVIFLRVETSSCGVGGTVGHGLLWGSASSDGASVHLPLILLGFQSVVLGGLCGGESGLLREWSAPEQDSRPQTSCSTAALLPAALPIGHPQGFHFKNGF